MKIEQKKFLDVLGTPGMRFTIPVFQRVYSWNTRQCEELWDDIVNAGRADAPHFMGMVLCDRDADGWHGIEQLDVIDGQQRMTTIALVLVALRGYLTGAGRMKAPGSGVPDPADIEQRYLQAHAEGTTASKLALSKMDYDTLTALVGAGEMPEEPAQRLVDNCLLFSQKMVEPGFDLTGFWRGLNQLLAAFVRMGPEDSPQLVFESLNSKGMPLNLADRVRNLIIASTSGEEQERLYTRYWMPLEDRTAAATLGIADAEPSNEQSLSIGHAIAASHNAADERALTPTDVLDSWLAQRYRSTRIFDESDVYGVFKTCLAQEYGGSMEKLLTDVLAFCDRFLADDKFRAKAQKTAGEWVSGKPEKLVSEFKLFGD